MDDSKHIARRLLDAGAVAIQCDLGGMERVTLILLHVLTSLTIDAGVRNRENTHQSYASQKHVLCLKSPIHSRGPPEHTHAKRKRSRSEQYRKIMPIERNDVAQLNAPGKNEV